MTTLNPVVVPVDWSNADAVRLRAEMAAEVGRRYAGRIPESLRDTTNAVDPESVQATLLVYVGAGAVGHAAVRWNGDDLELKRMYVAPTHRGTGTATALLDAAESAARAAGVTRLVLQTGDRQPDAIRFYERSGYRGSGSNRAENNTYGWTSDDAVVIGSGGALVCVRCGVGRGC